MKIGRGNLSVFPFQSWVDMAASLATTVGMVQSRATLQAEVELDIYMTQW